MGEVLGSRDQLTAISTPASESARGAHRHTRKQLLLAFVVAGASDAVSYWTAFVPPVQWGVDLATALLLFWVLGRRWAILPGLIAEAIPVIAIFPFWLLVVLSIMVYDDIRLPRKRA
jgi:hypothetical protein